MNYESNANSSNGVGAMPKHRDLSLDDCAEETHFRISALLRAYANPSPDPDGIVRRAVVLRDSLNDFVELLTVVIDSQKK